MKFIHPATKEIALNHFPLKDCWDFLSASQVLLKGDVANKTPLSWQQKLNCLKFYFNAQGVERLFVTSNRSGSRWSQLTLELALDLQNGGSGDFQYENDHFYPTKGQLFSKLDWRTPSGLWLDQHARLNGPIIDKLTFFVTHNNFSQLRTRQAKKMKTIVITRSIPAVLASLYSKLSFADSHASVTLNDEDSFPWEDFLGRLIDYFNSWGDVMTWHPAICHYKYEDICAEPLRTHMEMLDFWGLPVEEKHMVKALSQTSKQEMLNRMPKGSEQGNNRISTKSQAESRVISDSRLKYIIDRLNCDLKYDFGYSFNYETSYNTAYG